MGFFLLENEKCWELPETDYGKKFGSKRNKSLFLNCSFTMISQLLDLGRLVVYLYYKKIFFRRKKDLLNNFTHVDQGYIKALFSPNVGTNLQSCKVPMLQFCQSCKVPKLQSAQAAKGQKCKVAIIN